MFWVNTDNWLRLMWDDRSLRHFCFLEPVLSWHIYYRTTVPLASISRCLCIAIIPPCTQRQEVTASLPSGIYSFSTFFIPQIGYFCTFVFNQKKISKSLLHENIWDVFTLISSPTRAAYKYIHFPWNSLTVEHSIQCYNCYVIAKQLRRLLSLPKTKEKLLKTCLLI